MQVRLFDPSDYSDVARIYREGIETGQATFETAVPDWETWDRKMLPFCRFVGEEDRAVLGWASLSAVSARAVYAGVCEVSIYVAEAARGRGLGKMLLQTLIDASEARGIWTLQAGIFPENTASVTLHRKCGFRLVGYREKIGRMNGIWRNTLLLERRSGVVE